MRKFLFGGLAAALLLGASQARAEDDQICLLMPTTIGINTGRAAESLSRAVDASLADAQQHCRPDDLLDVAPLTFSPERPALDILSMIVERLCRFDRAISQVEPRHVQCIYCGAPRNYRKNA